MLRLIRSFLIVSIMVMWHSLALATTIEVKPQTLDYTMQFRGALLPAIVFPVTTSVEGRIESQALAFDSAVSKEAPLFTISNAQLKRQLLEAKQQHLVAQKKYNELNNWQYQLEALQLQRQLQQALSEQERLEKRVTQSGKLYKAGIISQEELNQDERMHQDALRTYEHYELMYSKQQSDNEFSLQTEAKQNLDLAQEAVERLEGQLQALTIQSPMSGLFFSGNALKQSFVGEKVEGKQVSAGDTLGYVGSTDDWVVQLEVTEHDLLTLHEGQPAVITSVQPGLPALNAQIQKIERNQLSMGHDKTSRYPVTITIAALDPEWEPHVWFGSKVEVRVREQRDNVLIIPKEAVLLDADGAWVQAEQDQKLIRKKVTLGTLTWQGAEILEGVASGDIISTPYQS